MEKLIERFIPDLLKCRDIKKIYPLFLTLAFVLFFAAGSFAGGSGSGVTAPAGMQQQKTVNGKVTDKNGAPLPGVTVVIKGTTQGNITDNEGQYTLSNVPMNATLVFSFVGMQTQEILVSSQSVVNIALQEETIGIEEVVAVGYGTQKTATITGSITTVQADQLKGTTLPNLTNSIVGRLPGVVVVQDRSVPGFDNSTIRVRGSNTLGDNSPLVVIDGIANRSMQRLNPEEIKEITVLKDASAAIYGAQAANGVILITTKRGVTGKPTLSLTVDQGWTSPTVLPEMCDATTYASMINELYHNDGKSAKYTDEEIQKFADGSDPWRYPNTDWFDATFNDQAVQQRANLSLRGGTESIKYFMTLGGNFQDGIFKNSAVYYKQANFRSNIDAKISKNINLSFDILGRQENRYLPTRSQSDIFWMLIRGYPTEPAYWPNGKPGPDIEYGNNPVVITTNQTGYDRRKNYVFESLLKLDVTIPWVKGLSVSGNVAMDKSFLNRKLWETPWYLYNWDKKTYDSNNEPLLVSGKKGFSDPALEQFMEDGTTLTYNGLLNYQRTFSEVHNFSFLAGFESRKGDYMSFSAFRRYFPSEALDQLFAGGDAEKTNTGSASQSGRLNYFGRINYNFMEKYLAEFVWRYDGSYMFPEDKRFGFFPGISLGWRISEENFWKNNLSVINYMKLRASWGQTGNDRIDSWQYLASYAFNTATTGVYVVDNSIEQKLLYESRIPNKDITWEVANQSNVGFDAQMFGGALSFSLEYFYNLRTNILAYRNASVPTMTGFTLPRENIGKVSNQGFDFTVAYHNKLGRLNYNIALNGGTNDNKIIFWDETPGVPEYQKSTGFPMGSGLYYEAIGIFKDQAAIDAYPHWANARPGDIIFKDVNLDKKIDGLDRVRYSYTDIPTFQGGLNIDLDYRNFYVSFMLQWATGATASRWYEAQGEMGNYFAADIEGRWTETNTDASKPRLWNRYVEYWRSNDNTYWLVDADYLRLKTAELGYNVPPQVIEKFGLQGLRLYTNGVNLLTFTKVIDFDPEGAGRNVLDYPMSKVFNFGAILTF